MKTFAGLFTNFDGLEKKGIYGRSQKYLINNY